MGCSTSVDTANYTEGTFNLQQNLQTFVADQLLIQEVSYLKLKLIQVHSAMGLFRPAKHEQFQFVKPDTELLKKLYLLCHQSYPTTQNHHLKDSMDKTLIHSQIDSHSKLPPFPSKYFENLSAFLSNSSLQSFLPLAHFFKMYATLTKLPPDNQSYPQVLFTFLAKGQPFLQLSQFKQFLSVIGLDIAQLQNLMQQMIRSSPKNALKSQSPIFLVPALIEEELFAKYLKAIRGSQTYLKSISTFQQGFSLLKNNKAIFWQYYHLKQLLIDEEINEIRNYGQQVSVVSKKWYDNFIKIFHKIYDTCVLKGHKTDSKSNFIRIKANKSPKKDKKLSNSTQLKKEEVSQSNLYALLKSQLIDNRDVQGEYELQLKQEKNPQLSFKIISLQLYDQIRQFLQNGALKLNPASKSSKVIESKRQQYRRRVLQKEKVQYYPVLIYILQVSKKGKIDEKNPRKVLVPQTMTLKELKISQGKSEEKDNVSFFVKYIEEKNFRQETNHSAKIKDLIKDMTSKTSKLIVAIANNRVGFIEQNTRKQVTIQNLILGDKVYAFSQKYDSIQPAYVLAKNIQKDELSVHFIGKSWRDETKIRAKSIFLRKQQFEDSRQRPSDYFQLYTGLINVGNTCYINSSLQALLSTTIFSTLLNQQPISTRLFSYQLQTIFAHMASPPLAQKQQSSKQVIEIRFKKNMAQFFNQFNHWQQQDTQQFIHAVLDKVSEQQKHFIQKIFTFWIENELICSSKTCNGKKVNKQAMTMITLPIPEPKQIYIEILFVPIYRENMQKILIKFHPSATLGQLLRKFEERSGIESHRVIMVEIDNGVLKGVMTEMTQSLKDQDSVTLAQLGIMANFNLAAYEIIKEQRIYDLIKRNNRNNEKRPYYDFFMRQTKAWSVAKILKPNSSLVTVEYLNKDGQITKVQIPKVQIQNKAYMIESLGVKTLQSEQFYVKLFMRKLVQSPVNNNKIIQNFGIPFMITLPIWSNYNDALSIIYEQVQNVITKAEHNEHYTIRFIEPKKQKCIFCDSELSRVFTHNQDLLKKCCKVLQSDTPILFLASGKSFAIFLDWKNINYYNSSFSSGMTIDRACKATEEELKQQKVSLYECFNLLRIKQEVEMTCELCKHPKMYRQESISTLPPILIIQLKEYRFINQKETMLKLNTNLRYDEVKKIDLEPYLAPNSILRESANFSSVYELYSVIQHVGSGNSGHYTVICKRKMRDSDEQVWVFFDDKYSRIVRESQVQDYMNNAYMLFYRKQYLGIDARLKLKLI